jgi:hypothetical protein
METTGMGDAKSIALETISREAIELGDARVAVRGNPRAGRVQSADAAPAMRDTPKN